MFGLLAGSILLSPASTLVVAKCISGLSKGDSR